MGKAIEATDVTFDNEVKCSTIPVLVDFWAPWCGPCRKQLPIIEEVAQELAGKVKVVKINVDENTKTASGFDIATIPALMIFVDGKLVYRFLGSQSKSQLLNELQKYMVN
jgi:thioredoxin 1